MSVINISKGLDLPISGVPFQELTSIQAPRTVALLGPDYPGVKLRLLVKEGDLVKLGQPLFEDKLNPEVCFTSPGGGQVVAVNRGAKRSLLSVVVELAENEERITFPAYAGHECSRMDRRTIREHLCQSGLWPALRSRPFDRVAHPQSSCHSLFVTAMDTNPLAPAVDLIIKWHQPDFERGLRVLLQLTDGKIFICKKAGIHCPHPEHERIVVQDFSGIHPAGNVGTHIHFLDPVNRSKEVWHIGAQDVIAFGSFFGTGQIPVDKVIALGGPLVKAPRLMKTRRGACLAEVCQGELSGGEYRIISGSVLSGHRAHGPLAYLGRYHQQISVITEDREREFLGWLSPGLNKFSVLNIFFSKLIPGTAYNFTTALHGGVRPIVPIGLYDKVMPLDILPTFLLRALAVEDIETAEKLGCLELVEEDIALCSFVCPSKIDWGPILRRNLMLLEKEG